MNISIIILWILNKLKLAFFSSSTKLFNQFNVNFYLLSKILKQHIGYVDLGSRGDQKLDQSNIGEGIKRIELYWTCLIVLVY